MNYKKAYKEALNKARKLADGTIKDMTKEEKELLLKDLCARLSYGVICSYDCVTSIERTTIEKINTESKLRGITWTLDDQSEYTVGIDKINALSGNLRPYLRPMSSMTKGEAIEMSNNIFTFYKCIDVDIETDRVRCRMVDEEGNFSGHAVLFFNEIHNVEQLDWLLKRHFDYRGLIEKDLPLKHLRTCIKFKSL